MVRYKEKVAKYPKKNFLQKAWKTIAHVFF